MSYITLGKREGTNDKRITLEHNVQFITLFPSLRRITPILPMQGYGLDGERLPVQKVMCSTLQEPG